MEQRKYGDGEKTGVLSPATAVNDEYKDGLYFYYSLVTFKVLNNLRIFIKFSYNCNDCMRLGGRLPFSCAAGGVRNGINCLQRYVFTREGRQQYL